MDMIVHGVGGARSTQSLAVCRYKPLSSVARHPIPIDPSVNWPMSDVNNDFRSTRSIERAHLPATVSRDDLCVSLVRIAPANDPSEALCAV